jgi:hypothetical protein
LTRYGNNAGAAGYTYKKPTKDRMYIKILNQLVDGPKTKAEVHLAIGLPDPTIKNGRRHANNYYTSVWQEMRRAGLVDFVCEDGTVKWFITTRGMDLLDEANGVNMKMDLDEATSLLHGAGFLVEDTETQDDEYDDTVRKLHATYKSGTGHNGFSKSLLKKKWGMERQHLDLDDKIKNAKSFNQGAIDSVEDIIKLLIEDGVVKPGEAKVSDEDTIYIPPAFEGDGAIGIKLDRDDEKIIITHSQAGRFVAYGLTPAALDDAWNRMTSKAY